MLYQQVTPGQVPVMWDVQQNDAEEEENEEEPEEGEADAEPASIDQIALDLEAVPPAVEGEEEEEGEIEVPQAKDCEV